MSSKTPEKIGYQDHQFKKDVLSIKHLLKDTTAEAVIAPYRGGLTLGTKLSHVLDLPLGIVEYQRLDSNSTQTNIRLNVDPVSKDGLTNFIFMKKVILVDDICDSGLTIEKIYKFLRILNPNIEIEIICLFGNENAVKALGELPAGITFKYLNDNQNKWVTFETWENDFDTCSWCNFGEPCYNNPGDDIHCHPDNTSYPRTHKCEKFSLMGTVEK